MNIPVHLQVMRYPALDPVLELTPQCSLDLLRSFYLEGLVDNGTFLMWLSSTGWFSSSAC